MAKKAIRPMNDPTTAWFEDFPANQRVVLREHGVPPYVGAVADEYNARVVELAAQGLAGRQLAEAVSRLRESELGVSLKRASNAAHLDHMIQLNRVGLIDQVSMVVVQSDGMFGAAVAGYADPSYLLQTISAAADVLDEGWGVDTLSAGIINGVQPPQSSLTGNQKLEARASIEKVLRALSAQNAHGEIAGNVAVMLSPGLATYRLFGDVPRESVDLLRRLRDKLERDGRAN